MGFIKVVLIIILVYYAFKFLFKFLAKRFLKKMQDKMGGQQEDIKDNRKEGEVKVEFTQDKNSKTSKSNNVAEDVDFEVIED